MYSCVAVRGQPLSSVLPFHCVGDGVSKFVVTYTSLNWLRALRILLASPPPISTQECCDYRCVLPPVTLCDLEGSELWSSHVCSKHFTHQAISHPPQTYPFLCAKYFCTWVVIAGELYNLTWRLCDILAYKWYSFLNKLLEIDETNWLFYVRIILS